ncbi:MAG: zf-HC2 domain-containing protein [Firmicutes bacterium]|jgi:ABC-type multidrug transport system fused ATPase/permease subunit|nr:zf-HC2 domain-containing protein [Bacillota bacterium]
MKLSCDVIKDILPLYVENMVSSDTRRIVEEHIAACESCKKQLAEMSTPQNLPADIDTAPLRRLKAILRKNKIKIFLLSVMLTLAAAVAVIAFLTTPQYIPYSENPVTIKENADGSVLAIFSDAVSGYSVHRYPADKSPGYVYHITAWNSIWSRYIGKSTARSTVLNPGGGAVASVYYYTPYRSGERLSAGDGDILIYGQDQVPGGGVQTLPRAFLAYYFFLAAGLAIFCIIAMYLLRRHEKARNVIFKIFLLPVAYLLGSLCIKDFYFPSYSATRDFYAILLVTIPLYIMLLSASYLIKEFKRV